MRDFFGMGLVLALPFLILIFSVALIYPKCFKRANTAPSRKYIALAFAALLLSWVLSVIFASGAGGIWFLGFAALCFYLSLHAYSLAPKFAPEPVSASPVATVAAQPTTPATPQPFVQKTPAQSDKDIELHELRAQLNGAQMLISDLQDKIDQSSEKSADKHQILDHVTSKRVEKFDNKQLKSQLHRIIIDITSDGILSIDEINSLKRWIINHHLSDDPKIAGLYKLLKAYTEDGELSYAEEEDLLNRFAQWTGYKPPAKAPASIPIEFEVNTSKVWKGKTIQFEYVDAVGEHSKRVVKVSKNNGDKIMGYCYGARAPRTFIKERMGLVIDTETGELLQS